MRLRVLLIGSLAVAVAMIVQASKVAADGASPYFMPDMTPTPVEDSPSPVFYYQAADPKAAPLTPSAAKSPGPSPYSMPDMNTPHVVPASASASSATYKAGAGKAYDMSIFLNQRHPFDTGPAPVIPVAAQKPSAVRAAESQAKPKLKPVATAVDNGDAKAGAAKAEEKEVGDGDPLEPMNRFFFGFNEYLQDYLMNPIATAYNWLPGGVRGSVGNFLENAKSPVVLANDLLQFELRRAWKTTERLAINSTAGVGGLFDVADYLGIEGHKEDFGQTLAVWGVGEWFYVVLPLFGPSNPRDAVGKMFVDRYFDPLSMWLSNTDREEISWSLAGVGAVDEYAGIVNELKQIKSTSIDYYAAIRSMYRQKRDSEIRNGDNSDMPTIPDLYDELDGLETN